MRLSWNEIRARAAGFAREWADETYEKGETQSFYNEFFQIFGVRRRTVARYEEHVRRLDDTSGFIDLFWPGVLLVEQKSAGRDLTAAREQAGAYFDALPERDRPRYQLLCDFQTFELLDRSEREETRFALADLPQHVEKFGFILGVQRRTFRDQDPVNIEASELIARLHDALKASGYEGHDLQRFLVRTVFCLFADDTGIFEPRDLFLQFIEERTSEDGADLGPWLARVFQVLNTPLERRQKALDEDLSRFPHVNGDLFADQLLIPDFDRSMREALLEAGRFDWTAISPAIFGALFQSVMEPSERRAAGAHYTTEKNILKVIEPLFLDALRAEFSRLKERRDGRSFADLQKFRDRLGSIRCFDPACGCGNFLIIAYRELRSLEIEVIREMAGRTAGVQFAVDVWSVIDVDQFYGIEIGEFPARIAATALWMMDHIMNTRLSLEFGQTYARIPIEKSPRIHNADALEIDWADVLPPEQCSYVFGNPPFGGAKYQSPEQRTQVRRVAALGGSGGSLDYVTAWFIRAGEYARQAQTANGNQAPRIGFVATNSITQGEQVAQLWPVLFEGHNLEITYAHRTFAWGSDARGKANVHVVIIGLDLSENDQSKKRLFSYDDVQGEPLESSHSVITPYLLDGSGLTAPQIVVREESRPINGMRQLLTGSQPIDNGLYIFDAKQCEAFLETEPEATPLLRPFVGTREYLHGGNRWILDLHDVSPAVLAQLPNVRERIATVRAWRRTSKRKSTLRLADTPTLWQVNLLPTSPFLVLPEVSSERREYVPIGWLEPPTIPSNLVRVLENATLAEFALLTSAMHMAWLRHVGGRLESRYRYSIGLVYNTFSVPSVFVEESADLSKLERLAQAVLDARAMHPEATLADLYHPELMPANLRKAHQALDSAVDRLYRRGGFQTERERIEHLFMLYERMRVPLDAARKQRTKRRHKGFV
ncbi:MAG: class I SAM-dependent DNA methyltransferase [Acidobacteriia bacterium]|nr:class I SAM-dependent DNA methyltransferase [Terriglobia bacterium]